MSIPYLEKTFLFIFNLGIDYTCLSWYTIYIKDKELEKMRKTENVTLEGHTGTWYKVSDTVHNGRKYYLWESEQYGEDANHIITDSKLNVMMDDAYEISDIAYVI